MPIPEALRGRLRLPAVAAPMFLTSGPDLVVECCRAGVIAAFPALNQRTHRGLRRLDGRDRRPARRRAAGGALGRQPDRPPLEPAARRRPRGRWSPTGCRWSSPRSARCPTWWRRCTATAAWSSTTSSRAATPRRRPTPASTASSRLRRGRRPRRAPSAPSRSSPRSARSSPAPSCSPARSRPARTSSRRRRSAPTSPISGPASSPPARRRCPRRRSGCCSKAAPPTSSTRPAISGVPANFLRPSLVAAGLDPDTLPRHKLDLGAEAKAWKTVWSAGQGVGSIDDLPTARDLCDRLAAEYAAARAALCG